MIEGKDFIYTHIPKTAGTFISECLINNKVGERILTTHSPAFDAPRTKRMLASIRNPFEYYVSLYHFLREYRTRHPDVKLRRYNYIRAFRVNQSTFKQWMLNIMNPEDKVGKVRFNFGHHQVPVVKYMVDNDVGIYTIRYMYMTTEENDKLEGGSIIDSFIRVENLNEDLEKECGKMDIPTKKVNTSNHKHYSEYYDQELIDLVKHKSRVIIDRFNYHFEGGKDGND